MYAPGRVLSSRQRSTASDAFASTPSSPLTLASAAGRSGVRVPGARERRLQRAGALLQDVSRDLFGVGARMRKADRELERARPHAELCADRDVARTGAIVGLGDESIGVVQLDMDVGAAVVAGRRAAEGTDDADPYVLLAHQQGRRMRVEHLAEVALGAGPPVRGGLHEESDVRQLGSEGA